MISRKKVKSYFSSDFIHQNTPNFNSNTHFRPPEYPGGASGGQNLKMALPGGYLEDRIWVLWNFCPIFGHLTLFRWLKFEIVTWVVYPHPLSKVFRSSQTPLPHVSAGRPVSLKYLAKMSEIFLKWKISRIRFKNIARFANVVQYHS